MIQLVVQSLKIATIGVMTLLVVLGGSRFFDYYQDKNIPAGVGKAVTVKITEDDDIDSVAGKLKDKKLIRFEAYFKGLMQINRKDFVTKSYKLRRGMTTTEIIDAITTGSVKTTTQASNTEDDNKELTLTIPEGFRTEQIADTLDEIGYKPGGKAFLDAVKNYPSDRYDFLKDRPDETSLEGFLFPDTYTVRANDPPEDILQRLLDNFDNKITNDMRDRAAQMGLSLTEVLTFASLVEREAQIDQERPIIADVFESRFENGIRMDSDPTVRYGIGKKGDDWWAAVTGADLEDESNPFNTYKIDGLPPHPICNPGIASIAAVLEPAQSDYIYFVALSDGSGKHLFATNPDDQVQNTAFLDGTSDSTSYCADPFAEGCPFGPSGGGGGDTGGDQVPIEQTGG